MDSQECLFPLSEQVICHMPVLPKVDLVVERQWHIGMHARALADLGCLGTVFGGFPAGRYQSQGIPKKNIKTRPFASLGNHFFAKAWPFLAFRWDEPRAISRWVSRQKSLAPVIACYATAPRHLFPLLSGRGSVLILERGSTHPENYFYALQKARAEAGLPFEEKLARETTEEIEAGHLSHFVGAGSQMIAHSYVQRGYDPDRILLAAWCTDPERFTFCDRRERARHEIVLLSVGIVGLRKGLGRILAMARWAERSNLRVRFRLVGPLEPEAPAMLGRAPSNVEWVGVKKGLDLVQEYHRADIYVLPSYEEGFGISILEALSTGLPVLVSSETGGKQSILQGQNGFILEDFSDYSFEAVLAPLLTQHKERLSMATTARQTVLKNHTEEHYRKTLQAEYLRMFSIVEKAGPALGPAWRNPCS